MFMGNVYVPIYGTCTVSVRSLSPKKNKKLPSGMPCAQRLLWRGTMPVSGSTSSSRAEFLFLMESTTRFCRSSYFKARPRGFSGVELGYRLRQVYCFCRQPSHEVTPPVACSLSSRKPLSRIVYEPSLFIPIDCITAHFPMRRFPSFNPSFLRSSNAQPSLRRSCDLSNLINYEIKPKRVRWFAISPPTATDVRIKQQPRTPSPLTLPTHVGDSHLLMWILCTSQQKEDLYVVLVCKS
jgi:hypothetical protein